ncbi:hypothetical protein PENSUB_6268 [Penicillium subrubescens]|uniref:Transcription factor domain-containing protein n=2 Tax=Penicillium subrubescens TaxID=1316194 RepID=A0A1Q5U1C2_9EURO|nr:hypothetical protein PENSUB_6268 [Penicillium subrubescens]
MKHVFKLQKQGLVRDIPDTYPLRHSAELSWFTNQMYAPMLFKSFGSDFDYLKQYNTDRPFDELFEIYVEITILAAAANSINKLDQDCEHLLWSCRAHQRKALEWYSRNLESIGGRPISCSIDKLKHIKVPLPSAKSMFDSFYEFGSLRQAELHVFFWKAMIIIQLLIYRAQVLVLHCSRPDHQRASIESIPTDPGAYSECMIAGKYADEMCRAIPYFLQDGMGSYGMLKITVNLPYILKSYTHLRCKEKFLWIQKICQSVASDGNDLALCHSQVWWKYWFLCEDPTTNYIRSLAFNEDYTERYHVSVEGDFVKVIKVTKDGESSVASEISDMPAARHVLDVSDTREPLELSQILS